MNKAKNIRLTLKDIGLKPKITLCKNVHGMYGKIYMVHTTSEKAVKHLRNEGFSVSKVEDVLLIA